MRLRDWPRMPYLNEELVEWIELELRQLGLEDLAVYAVEEGRDDEERRVLIATEIGLLDHWYAPQESTARYGLTSTLYAWPQVRGLRARGSTYRLWAKEFRTRWWLRMEEPAFEAETDEAPEQVQALRDLARICAERTSG